MCSRKTCKGYDSFQTSILMVSYIAFLHITTKSSSTYENLDFDAQIACPNNWDTMINEYNIDPYSAYRTDFLCSPDAIVQSKTVLSLQMMGRIDQHVPLMKYYGCYDTPNVINTTVLRKCFSLLLEDMKKWFVNHI